MFQIPSQSAYATPTDERPRPVRRTTNTWHPPVAGTPGGYQQGGAAGTPTIASTIPAPADSYFPKQQQQEERQQQQQQPPSSNPIASSQPTMAGYTQGYGYGQPGQQPQPQQQQDMGGLTQQMGQMGMDGGAPQTHRKKKDRHAYHQLEQPAANSQAYAGAPSGQFMNGQQNQFQPSASPAQAPWQSQTSTPAMNQFPAQAGTPIAMDQQQQQQRAQGAPGGAQGKVNPDQIPGVPLSRDMAAEYYRTHVYPTMEQHLPPPASTPFVAFDQGNSSPKYARLTLNCIPTTNEQMTSTGLPLGLSLQPLAKQADGEQAIPVLDFGDVGPPRCRRCRAYINPFMIFSNGGNRMTCNLCGHPNEVPPEYFAPTDPQGIRVDRGSRPELTLGTCEFLVPKEYWSKEPVPMRYLFLIDVSAESCNRGFLQGVCDGLLAALYGEGAKEGGAEEANGENLPKPSKIPPGARVGFVAFDREIHFYKVAATMSAPQELVVSDLEDPFAAVSPEHLFVDPTESRANITTLLQRMPTMFSSIRHAENALLPAMTAALAALDITGGKIICTLASMPTHGPGRLFPRDKGQSPNDDSEHMRQLLRTEHPQVLKTQAAMVKAGVGVDFFLSAPAGGYMDLAAIGHLAEKTGGDIFYYPNWSYPRDALRLEKELSHTVQREQGFAALMKVRCSQGLQLAQYSGSFTQHTFGADLELASVSEDSGVGVTFSYDGKLDPKLDAHFQAALLYTTATGERRVRCTNTVASVTPSPAESMRFVDQDAVLTIMAKEAASKATENRSLKEVRQALQDKSIDILAGYRKQVSGSHPSGQLVLPENLKEFGMYMLGLFKSRALKGGKEPSDRRSHEIRLLKSMGPAELSLYLYPRIISLHNLDPTDGFADENGHLKMPSAVRASFSQIEEGGAYLVDNGQILLLWLHNQVSPNLLEDLFGPGFDSLQALDPNTTSLPVLETQLNAQARNILIHLEGQRGSKGLAIQLARQGLDGAEFEFARLLYEDRNGEASSYVDWLVLLHRGVGMELAGQRSKGSGEDGGILSSITGQVPYWG